MGFLEGTKARPLESAGAPTNGTNEVESLGLPPGTASSGVFTLSFEGFETASIAFNANAAAIQAAMEALPSIGTGNLLVAGGALPGITVTMTFRGSLAKKAISVPIAPGSINTLDAGAPSISVGVPGVDAFRRGSGKGALAIDVTNGKEYINTGADIEPVWTVVGTQT